MARETSSEHRGEGAGTNRPESFLITGAETSLEEQQKARVRRYMILMSFRIPALLIATLVYVQTQNAWWAVGIIILSVPLPWIAVLIANDRAPRKRGEVQYYRYGPGRTVGPGELTAEPSPPPPTDPFADGRVIDSGLVEPADQPGDGPNDEPDGPATR